MIHFNIGQNNQKRTLNCPNLVLRWKLITHDKTVCQPIMGYWILMHAPLAPPPPKIYVYLHVRPHTNRSTYI